MQQIQFTRSQRDVITLMSKGLSNREIAALMGLTLKGVKFHITNIYKIIGISSTANHVKLNEFEDTGAKTKREHLLTLAKRIISKEALFPEN